MRPGPRNYEFRRPPMRPHRNPNYGKPHDSRPPFNYGKPNHKPSLEINSVHQWIEDQILIVNHLIGDLMDLVPEEVQQE